MNHLVKLCIFIAVFINLINAQDFQWAKVISSNAYAESNYIDNSGNCYVTGYFSGTAIFDSMQIMSNGGADFYIAKYDANGNLLWIRTAGGSNRDFGNCITIDDYGNSYVTGQFQGTATFNTTNITSNGGEDIFIAKYDGDGNLLWVQKAGGTSGDIGKGISTDNYGNCYVTGWFGGTAMFSTTQITSTGIYGYEDIFIAKYDINGNFQWVRKAGGSYSDYGIRISTDNFGNSYLTGQFRWSATFGTTQFISNGDFDIFIAKYDPNGILLWVKQAGGEYEDIGYDVSEDNFGNCYITGQFVGTATFGSSQITSNGGG